MKLTLIRPGGASTDLALTVESNTTVDEIAKALRDADPVRSTTAGDVSLRLHADATGGAVRVLDPGTTVAESGIASGARVSIAPSGSNRSAASARAVAGSLSIVSGPDAGRSFPLLEGSNPIGRDPQGRVVLADALVSKSHARINLTDVIEIIDLGSANGTLVNGVQIARTALVTGDVVSLGDTSFTVSATVHAAARGVDGIVEFSRSPRLDPVFVGTKFKAPENPEKGRAQRLPFIALLAPLVMGAVLFAITPSAASIAFFALSPLLILASFIDGALLARRDWKAQVADFDASMSALGDEVTREREAERAGRLAEAPSVAAVLDGIEARSPLLWTRRPEHHSFLTLRLGLGTMPSRLELEVPNQRKGVPEHWQRIQQLATMMRSIEDVPVTESFLESGNIGVAGPHELARGVARGLILELVGLHSPAEVVVASIASTASAPAWDWLKWLPHVGSPHSPLGEPPLASDGPAVSALVSGLEDLVATRHDSEPVAKGAVAPVTVVVLVEDDAPVERARLTELAERGPAVGVHLVWVSVALERLPAACRTFLDIHAATGESVAGFVRAGYGVHPVTCETVDQDRAVDVARCLAPVIDAGARLDDSSDLPRSISLLGLLGDEVADDPEEIIGRWQQTSSILTGPRASTDVGKRKSTLRAVFGQAADEHFSIDLRADGPHALVGGTTGAGKSEFLQAWVLGMASAHSPQRVAFLFVDYKGGAAFAECVNLPHTVGLVTDLSQHLVRRALSSLRAELTFREHLLNRKHVKDLQELERTGDPETPPSLIIIVDEFAALVTEVPEFVDGVVDVAQRGRSLGLHLVLATQRPAGVIKDNLRANTNLRVALRMADEENSADVLGTADAAFIDPAIPGRGYAKTGPGRIKSFQTGYAGGWSSGLPQPGRVDIQELRFGPPLDWEAPPNPEFEARLHEVASGPTDIKRVVEVVRKASTIAAIPAPRKPWLPSISDVYDISKLPTKRTDEALVFGVVDDSAHQAQPVVSFNPDRDGNMSIIGTGGSGKTTALRAIASAAASTVRGGPVNVYGLDFAGGGLRMLEALPHVGSIVTGDDEERLGRLLRWLRELVDQRSILFADVHAATIVEYRKISGDATVPRILLLVDGMGAFRDAYESAYTTPWFEVFSQIATDGRQVGVHIVLTGDRPGAIPNSLGASIQRQLVLRLANADEYQTLGVPNDVLSSDSPPGRGMIDGLEAQVAVRGGDPNVAVQARALEDLAAAMREAGIADAAPIQRLADRVYLPELPAMPDASVPIGIADASLAAIGIQPVGGFIVTGPPGSGRTTALETIVRSIKRSRPSVKLYLFSTRSSPLDRIGKLWDGVALGTDQMQALAGKLATTFDAGKGKPGDVVVVLEHLGEISDDPAASDVETMIRSGLRHEQFVVGETETSTWGQAYTLGQLLRAARRGLLVQPDDGDGDQLLNTETGRIRRNSLPQGRGFLIGGGRATRLQVALPGERP